MIKIYKGSTPDWLIKNGPRLTAEFLIDTSKTPWRTDHVKVRLKEESHSKCAYCEGFVPAVSYLNVEHILPKSKFPELVLEWSNLVGSCVRCNTNKGDYHSEEFPLLDPTSDDPTLHLKFIGAVAYPALGDRRAIDTIKTLELNRPDLLERRETRMEELLALLHARQACRADMQSVLDSAIASFFEPSAEYSAALINFHRALTDGEKVTIP